MLVPPLPSSDPRLTRLPLGQRFLFSSLIPNAIFTVLVRVSVYLFFNWPTTPRRSGPDAGNAIGLMFAIVWYGAMATLVFGLPIDLCTLLAAFRPWQRWYTALAGGFAGVGVGLVIGGVFFILKLTSN